MDCCHEILGLLAHGRSEMVRPNRRHGRICEYDQDLPSRGSTWESYVRTAKQLAERAVKDNFDKLVACDPAGKEAECSLVLWVNELSAGNLHSHVPHCYVLAGGAGGALQGNRYLRINEPHNNLLVSVLNLMGIEANSFGEPGFSTGPLRTL